MRLYLAVALLMLACVAYTAAQEETIEEKFTKFGQTVAEKARTTLDQIQNSEFAITTSNWFQERLEQLKKKFGDQS